MISSAAVPPPPRRTSCSACAKAKRRCDQQNPICSRCIKKNLICTYAKCSHRTISTITPSCSTYESTAMMPPTSPPCVLGDFQLDFATDPELFTDPFDPDGSRFLELNWATEPECTERMRPIQPCVALITPPSTPAYRQEDYSRMEYVCVRRILVDPT